MYGYTFYSISSSDAFKAFSDWCVQSRSLQVVVGQFKKTELPFFGNFYEKNKGETGQAGFTVRIVGSTKTINAEVTMKREHDTWQVDQVLIAGERLDVKGKPQGSGTDTRQTDQTKTS